MDPRAAGSTGRSAGLSGEPDHSSGPSGLLGGNAGPWLVALAGFLMMFAPSYWQAANGLWTTDEFGHAPIILAIAGWLFWQRRDALVESLGSGPPRSLRPLPPEGAGMPWDGPSVAPGRPKPLTAPSGGSERSERGGLAAGRPAPWIGGAMFAAGALLYLAGRALSIASAEFVAHWLVLGAALAWLGGTRALRAAWFPWLYLLFMVPLPATLVDAMTGPLKHAVSVLVVEGLHLVGYPIARSGVMITVGPYQLLVADACSGLNSMFSLAALGTLFIHVVAARRKFAHVALLVASIVPIAFAANVVRVVALVLVTYHLGDAAGQGFLHGAAGIVLMLVALAIFFGLDLLLAAVFGHRGGAAPVGLAKDSARA